MSSDKPTFPQSLVAYGSSPETSEDEDTDTVLLQDRKSTSSTAEIALKKPEESSNVSDDIRCPETLGSVDIDQDSGLCSPEKVSDLVELCTKAKPHSTEDELSPADLSEQSNASVEKEEKTTDLEKTALQQEVMGDSDVNLARSLDGVGEISDMNDFEGAAQSNTTVSIDTTVLSDSNCNPLDALSCQDANLNLPESDGLQDEVKAIEDQDSELIPVRTEATCLTEDILSGGSGPSSEPVIEDIRACDNKMRDFETTQSHKAFKETEGQSIPNSEDKLIFDEAEPDKSIISVTSGALSSAEESKQGTSPENFFTNTPGGRRLRQKRNPSVKAAEAAADAAFVAAVTPTRKNLKEAKIACALAKVSDTAEATLLPKKSSNQTTLKMKKGHSSSHERSLSLDKEDSNSSDKSGPEIYNTEEGKLSRFAEEKWSGGEDYNVQESSTQSQTKSAGNTEPEKPVGIKLKISRESVQILDPTMSKLEVQIPSEPFVSEVMSSPGGSKRMRKLKEGTPSPVPPLSPITLKIAKSKEGLEVVSNESTAQSISYMDGEVAKVEKITLKLSRDEGATIVKPNLEEAVESRPEKLSFKVSKDEGSTVHKFTASLVQDDVEETKLEKITLKLSKGDGACIVKKKENDPVSSSSEIEGGKLERITIKLSNDNNVSIVRPKETVTSLECSASASPEPGKIEKITLKVSKNDSVSIVKPASPTVATAGVEKLTLKVSKDGTAAVSGKHFDEPLRDGECSKLEKITLKLSKDEGVSIVKPVSPVPDRKSSKLVKDEPLSPLSPLIIARSEETEPQKERITLKLSKAGGHPSPVGLVDERSSWSIKSTDSDNVPSPVTSDPATPKSKPKRALSETPEAVPSSVKRLKLSEFEKSDDSDSMPVLEVQNPEDDDDEESTFKAEEEMDTTIPPEKESDSVLGDPKTMQDDSNFESPDMCNPAENVSELVLIDSQYAQSGPPPLLSEGSQESVPVVDIESEIHSSKMVRRKPRGRPRKAVLTPGAIPVGTPLNVGDTSPSTKPKREKIRPEPTECDRPKRSCKGREKPPPKPVKAAKPRGKAALAKQKAEQSLQPEGPQLFEEETRMSADCGSQSQTSAISCVIPVAGNASNGLIPKVIIPKLCSSQYPSLSTTPSETPAPSPGPVAFNEESQGSISMVSSTTMESTPNRGNRKGRMEINVDPEAQADFTVDMIAEYMWPLSDGHGETYMIQEQISAYLGVKSFKRKYPNMQRRTVDHDERQYLLERRLVSETLCDLGLTALPSHEVLDVLCTDFPEKFEEYRRHIRDKVQRELTNKQKALLPGVNFGKEDSKSKAMRNMASFNAMLNRSRRDQRRCCFDLQSFTVHYPEQRRQQMTVPNPPRVGPYPLALVPGQYTDYYKEFTPTELRYFPLNTVLYGPLLPHEMMRSNGAGGSDGSQTDSSDSSSSGSSSSDSDSSGSDSDSDSDSSSGSDDGSSNQTGTGAVDSQEIEVDRPDAVCRVCAGDRLKNKLGKAEPLVHCASCEKSGHLSCLDLTVDMFPHIRKYSWHCTDCKLCAQCNDTADEDKMLFCDMCDRGYHIYCVGLRKVPEGRWHCQECAICASCGAREPGGSEEHQATLPQAPQDTPTKSDAPQWQHEFKKGDEGRRLYVRTLCVPCSKLWKKGRYCRLCWKCYSNQPEEEGLINCSICDRWMHADCCRKAGRVIDVEKTSSYICELCQQKGVRILGNKTPLKVHR